MTDKSTEPKDAKPETPPQQQHLLDTVRDPKPIEDAEALDDEGEPGGDNFA